MNEQVKMREFLDEHTRLTRRFFLRAGALGIASGVAFGQTVKRVKPVKAGVQPEPYFTRPDDFFDVSRGNPLPHSLPHERKREAGLTRETWRLEVISDPDNPSRLRKPLTRSDGNALDFAALLKLGVSHSVQFAKVMTCLNLGCPLGMGLWKGVPLREVIWRTQPRENIRRLFYYGYHNDDPKQMFRSSLPIGRVLEDPSDLPPVILCYELNGQPLTPERGGPVRMVVPEAYGFKSIKWLTHVVVSNIAHANDTYAEQNNDVDSPLKTFAASLAVPQEVQEGQPIAVSGYAQVGVSGLGKVQVSIESNHKPQPVDDPYFTKSAWVDAEILGIPKNWGVEVPAGTHGFDASGKPNTWPMRLTNAHWAAVLPGMPPGQYTFRCRTIDEKGHAQPMPRPFKKSGHAEIESVIINVKV